jgi:hypothetical protein
VANLFLLVALPSVADQPAWRESDMAFSYQWSDTILAGDVLGRETPHQYTAWMESIAPRATWERWWGTHVFHQAPLYAYALAGMRLVAGDAIWRIGLCQAALGVMNVALVVLLAARSFRGAVPLLAGLGAALFGPFLLVEPFLLRDTLAVTTSLLVLWWLSGCDRPSLGRWLVGGLLMALAILTRETAVLFVPFVLLWIVRTFPEPATRVRIAVVFLAGLALGLVPLVARNLVVGAPPLALSARAIETFIHGNGAGASPTAITVPAEAGAILRQADGHLWAVVRLTVASYHGDWRRLVGNQLAKVGAMLSGYEGTDNVSWYYYADHSPLLRYGLRFHHLLALAVVGLWLERADGLRGRLRRFFVLATASGLLYGAIIGRYRLPLVAVLLVDAALGAERIALWWRGWDLRRAVPASLAVLAIGVASAQLRPDPGQPRYRGAEFLVNANAYYEHGEGDRALRELRLGIEKVCAVAGGSLLGADCIPYVVQPFIRIGHGLGRDGETAERLEELAERFPADAPLQQWLGILYEEGLHRPADAARHYEAAKRLARP